MGAYSALPTLTQVTKTVFGNKRAHFYTFATDGTSTWITAGFSLTPAMLGLTKIEQLFVDPGVSGLLFTYDYTNQMLHGYTCGTAGATNILVKANGSTPASATVSIMAIGYGLG
jgi:hypothetical protein